MADVVPVGLITIAISQSAPPAGGIELLAYTKKISRAGVAIARRPILFPAGAAQRVISITGEMVGSAPATCGIEKWGVSIAASRWQRSPVDPTANIRADDKIKAGVRRAIATNENMVGSARGIYGASDHTVGVNVAGRRLRLWQKKFRCASDIRNDRR